MQLCCSLSQAAQHNARQQRAKVSNPLPLKTAAFIPVRATAQQHGAISGTRALQLCAGARSAVLTLAHLLCRHVQHHFQRLGTVVSYSLCCCRCHCCRWRSSTRVSFLAAATNPAEKQLQHIKVQCNAASSAPLLRQTPCRRAGCLQQHCCCCKRQRSSLAQKGRQYAASPCWLTLPGQLHRSPCSSSWQHHPASPSRVASVHSPCCR